MENYKEEKGIIVWLGGVARNLLREGYTIIDVKPAKENKDKSVFVFRREEGIEDAIKRLSEKKQKVE